MNIIKNITIKNIKGKSLIDLEFDNLNANKIILLVAPNGYGKSTIVQAFESINPTKMVLNNDDIYQNDHRNKPEVQVTFLGENEETLIANYEKNEFRSDYDIKVINNAVVAKSSYNTAGAHLKIDPIVIYNKIPESIDIDYSYSNMKSSIQCEGKILSNITNFFKEVNNITTLYEIQTYLRKSAFNRTAQRKINEFLSNISSDGTAESIKNRITDESQDLLLSNNNIKIVFNTISQLEYFHNSSKVDIILSIIQIIEWYHLKNSEDSLFLKKLKTYMEYKSNREKLNQRLKLFNTTGRDIKTSVDANKIVVKFSNANTMSNGERDVLVFLTELFCFEIGMKKEKAILLIDEIFDYLDGSNLLVAQYYLSKFIEDCKTNHKLIYPLIFTHLDPEVFNNYYFKKKKTHYLVSVPNNYHQSDIVKIIQNRNPDNNNDFASKYLLHYNSENMQIPPVITTLVQANFPTTSKDFENLVYNETKSKYLQNDNYNPILVLIGVRIKVEEIAYYQLDEDKRQGFIDTHATRKKLDYANQYIEIPEILYLLQPLYNDGLHLDANPQRALNKIKSCCLKLYNEPIKNIIRLLFDM